MSVFNIETDAFRNCANLTCIAIANEEVTFGDNVFKNTPLESNYTEYKGVDKYCEDNIYYN